MQTMTGKIGDVPDYVDLVLSLFNIRNIADVVTPAFRGVKVSGL
jgi:hypothetical protein